MFYMVFQTELYLIQYLELWFHPWLAEGVAQYMYDADYDHWDTHRDMI